MFGRWEWIILELLFLCLLIVIGAEPGAARRQAGWPRHRMRWDRGGTAGAAATPSLAPR